MTLSVFTPSHDGRWLDDCYASLRAQTYDDWEWVVLLNNGAQWAPPRDPRVRVITDTTSISGVGAAKRSVVEECRGDILVELDHDDMLTSRALEHVAAAFHKFPDAAMVFSDFAPVFDADTPAFEPFGEGYGWRYKESRVTLSLRATYPVAMETTPHNVSYIWYAPNHVRAFSRLKYDKVGGYNADLEVLDDQDLMCRLYQEGEFVKINKCLYLQRTHDSNTQKGERNAVIQQETVHLYDRYIQDNALAWAGRNGLMALDLGGAHGNADSRYTTVDQYPANHIPHIVHTFPAPMDLPDSSVGVIRAVDFLEHVEDKVAMMNEIHRLLAPNGLLLSMTPSTDGRGAFQDPTHVAFWNENSFWYYTDPTYATYVPQIAAKFQVSRLVTAYPSPWHETHDISYVFANLIAIKEGSHRNGGALHW